MKSGLEDFALTWDKTNDTLSDIHAMLDNINDNLSRIVDLLEEKE